MTSQTPLITPPTFSIEEVPARAEWDALVHRLGGHLRQSWDWTALAGRPVHRRVVISDGLPVAAVAMTEIPLPGLSYTVLDAPRGPMLGPRSAGLWPAVIDAIRDVGRQRRAIFVRLSPATQADDADMVERFGEHGGVALSEQWTLWNLPRVVMRSDLSGTEVDVKRRMRETTRQSLRKAVNKGAVVASFTDAEAMARFHRLLVHTGRRKAYPVRRLEYFESLRRTYFETGDGVIVLATHEGRDIAGVMGVRFGVTGYVLYAGIDPDYRQLRAGVAVHWELMRWARSLGCDRMDWGGSVTNYPPTRLDEGYGIFDFKAGFGADVVLLAPYFDVVLRPTFYRAFRLLERHGGFLLALRSRFN